MWRPSILLAAALAGSSQALHFFMDGAVQKCFYEELPKDTLVVGMAHLHHILLLSGALHTRGKSVANSARPLPR